ncbi:MAG: hypothetical protein ACRDOH_12820, partial [Streptosporangiaceae bacterium]
NTLKKELTNVTSLQVASLTPGTVDLILGSDFTGLAPQAPQASQASQAPASPATSVTPQTSATPTVQPSSGASPSASASASGVAGLAQSNGGITAAAACTADSSAFTGPLSP